MSMATVSAASYGWTASGQGGREERSTAPFPSGPFFLCVASFPSANVMCPPMATGEHQRGGRQGLFRRGTRPSFLPQGPADGGQLCFFDPCHNGCLGHAVCESNAGLTCCPLDFLAAPFSSLSFSLPLLRVCSKSAAGWHAIAKNGLSIYKALGHNQVCVSHEKNKTVQEADDDDDVSLADPNRSASNQKRSPLLLLCKYCPAHNDVWWCPFERSSV